MIIFAVVCASSTLVDIIFAEITFPCIIASATTTTSFTICSALSVAINFSRGGGASCSKSTVGGYTVFLILTFVPLLALATEIAIFVSTVRIGSTGRAGGAFVDICITVGTLPSHSSIMVGSGAVTCTRTCISLSITSVIAVDGPGICTITELTRFNGTCFPISSVLCVTCACEAALSVVALSIYIAIVSSFGTLIDVFVTKCPFVASPRAITSKPSAGCCYIITCTILAGVAHAAVHIV